MQGKTNAQDSSGVTNIFLEYKEVLKTDNHSTFEEIGVSDGDLEALKANICYSKEILHLT